MKTSFKKINTDEDKPKCGLFHRLDLWLYNKSWRWPQWIQKWIYPAYGWSNLRHRSDIVVLDGNRGASEWHEYDWRLASAVFTVVSEFVDQEEKDRIIDWEYNEYYSNIWKQLVEIRDWWDHGNYASDRKYSREETKKMLHRAVELRDHLWT